MSDSEDRATTTGTDGRANPVSPPAPVADDQRPADEPDEALVRPTPGLSEPEPLPRIQPQSPPTPEWSSYGHPRFDQPAQPSAYGDQSGYGNPAAYSSPEFAASATSTLPSTAPGAPTGPAAPRPSSVVGSRTDADWSDAPRGPSGAGIAGFLGVVGLTAAAVGLFALPLQKFNGQEIVFAEMRHSAASGRRTGVGVPSLDSPLGGSLATFWWRYGALIAISVVALLLALMIAASATRRIGGALLFLGAGGATAAAVLTGTQTNDFGRTVTSLDYVKEQWQHWQVGAWVGLAGFAIAAFAGLVALLSGLGSDDD